MNYEDMSDKKIDAAVDMAKYFAGTKGWSTNYRKGIIQHEDGTIHEVGSWCNDPAYWGELMKFEHINLDHRNSIKAGAMASKSGNKEIYAVDHKIGRAISICYLKMMENNNG